MFHKHFSNSEHTLPFAAIRRPTHPLGAYLVRACCCATVRSRATHASLRRCCRLTSARENEIRRRGIEPQLDQSENRKCCQSNVRKLSFNILLTNKFIYLILVMSSISSGQNQKLNEYKSYECIINNDAGRCNKAGNAQKLERKNLTYLVLCFN